jgi:flagellar motility protein MotE (MotC chaperone)
MNDGGNPMTKILQSGWFCALIGGLSYWGVTVAVWRTPVIPRSAFPGVTEALKPSWEFSNPELDQLIADLRAQKAALAAREQQLNELAIRLKAEREEIGVVTQSVARLQAEFDRNVVRVKDEEVANLKKLAKMYAAMTPEGAANILKELPDDDMVRIFSFMKDSETAPILELLAGQGPEQAKRGARITERLRMSLARTTTAQKQP